jgi:hypothetical protein
VVDTGGAAAGVERAPEEDTAAAAGVEERVLGTRLEHAEHSVPRPCVDIVAAVDLARPAPVGTPRDAVGHSIDPPLADAIEEAQIAFWTFPALRHRVQTYARVALPLSRIRTRWRFGLKRRFVATIEWLRWLPKPGFLPQIEQTLDISERDGSGSR